MNNKISLRNNKKYKIKSKKRNGGRPFNLSYIKELFGKSHKQNTIEITDKFGLAGMIRTNMNIEWLNSPTHQLKTLYLFLIQDYDIYFKQIIKNTYYNLINQEDINEIYDSLKIQYSEVLHNYLFENISKNYKKNQKKILDDYKKNSNLSLNEYLIENLNQGNLNVLYYLGIDLIYFLYFINNNINLINEDSKVKILITKEHNDALCNSSDLCDLHTFDILHNLINDFNISPHKGNFNRIFNQITITKELFNIIVNSNIDNRIIYIPFNPLIELPCEILTTNGKYYYSRNIKLESYQQKAIEKYTENIIKKNKKGIILSHQMGTGKTILTISLIEQEIFFYKRDNKLRVIIVIPDGLFSTWIDELNKKCNINNDTYIINTDNKDIRVNSKTLNAKDVCVTESSDKLCSIKIKSHIFIDRTESDILYDLELYTYEQFSNKIINNSKEFDSCIIILDEAHRFELERQRLGKYIGTDNVKVKDVFNDRFIELHNALENFNNIFNAIKRAYRVILITGTPLYNSIYDIITLINLIKDEEERDVSYNRQEFNRLYCEITPMDKFWITIDDLYIKNYVAKLILKFIGNPVSLLKKQKTVKMKEPYDMYINGLLYRILLPILQTGIMVITQKSWIVTVVFFTLIYCIDEIWLKNRHQYIEENKTYSEEIFKIDVKNAYTIKMINRYFLFFNGQNTEMIDRNESEIAVTYTKSQNFFYTLFTYGIPVSDIMDLIFENIDKKLISSNDEDDIFIDEKSNYLRQTSTKMKYGLLIGNLILSDKINKLLEKIHEKAIINSNMSIDSVQKKIKEENIDKEIILYFQEIKEFTNFEFEFVNYKNLGYESQKLQTKPLLKTVNNIEWPNKFIELKKKLDEALSKNEKTMIYSNYVEKGTYLLEIFFDSMFEKKYLDKIVYLVNPATKEGRDINSKLLKKFNNNDAQIIVFHPDIMEGISLNECLHVHILEYIHQPAKYEQVIARARRNKSHQMTLSQNPNAKLNIYKYIIRDNKFATKTEITKSTSLGLSAGYLLYYLGYSAYLPAGLAVSGLCLGYDYYKHIGNQQIISGLSKDSHHFIGSQSDIDLIKSPDGYYKRIYYNLLKNNELLYQMLNDYSLDADEEKMEDKILSINYENYFSNIVNDLNLRKQQIYWNNIEEFWSSNNKYPPIIEEEVWERLEESTYI
jgi:hypothetical protein